VPRTPPPAEEEGLTVERVYFKYEVLTMLRLSREEVETLSKACESHYDHAVRALSIPGPRAILNAARNTYRKAKDGTEYAVIEVTHRQLDTLAKATESLFTSPFVSREGHPEFYQAFVKLMRETGAEFGRLNTAHIEAVDAELKELREDGA
jgi:hypothetical protein